MHSAQKAHLCPVLIADTGHPELIEQAPADFAVWVAHDAALGFCKIELVREQVRPEIVHPLVILARWKHLDQAQLVTGQFDVGGGRIG